MAFQLLRKAEFVFESGCRDTTCASNKQAGVPAAMLIFARYADRSLRAIQGSNNMVSLDGKRHVVGEPSKKL